ncbi:MAG TPA: hypothetical protein VGG34_04045 [Opitutaceae bacterium]|jgi:hypothetical protein
MPGRDYLMRLIEEAVQVIFQIASLRRERRPDSALAATVNAMERLFGMPAQDFMSLDPDGLFEQLTREEGAETARDKCLFFAALNQQAGLAYEEKDLRALAQPAFHLALVFTLRALDARVPGPLPAITPDVDQLLPKLDGLELPGRTRELLGSVRGARANPGR